MFIKILFSICAVSSLSLAFTLDKVATQNNNAFWKSHYKVPKYMSLTILATALIEGNQSRFGSATWKSLDSLIVAKIATEGIKITFGRERPRQNNGPDSWWKKGNKSFPSGHVSDVTAMVSAYIFEYQEDYPLVHALWLLPIHQMIGRVKAKAHWQTDVLTGFAVGVLSAYGVRKLNTPILLYFSKDNVFVGLRHRF